MFTLHERFQPVRQLTTAGHGHILANRNCWTLDSAWLLYDVRHDETVFDGQSIERVNVKTCEVQQLHQSLPNEYCGVPTCSPTDDRFVFIASPRWTGAGDDWRYSAWHRHGMLGYCSHPHEHSILDARDIVSPYTPGAMRGGTHLHMFSPCGNRIASTYEDHVLAEGNDSGKEENRRMVVVHELNRPVHVPQSSKHNQNGCSYTFPVTDVSESPTPGSQQYSRAHSEAWLGNDAIVFVGDVIRADGNSHSELFVSRFPDHLSRRCHPMSCGTPSSRPRPPESVTSQRLTFTDDDPLPGLGGPRHWILPSPDRSLLGCLRTDPQGHAQFWTFELETGRFEQRSNFPFSITSCFTWHPTHPMVTFIADRSVWCLRLDVPAATRWTPRLENLSPTHHACVFSPDGTQIAFQSSKDHSRQSFQQLFTVQVAL